MTTHKYIIAFIKIITLLIPLILINYFDSSLYGFVRSDLAKTALLIGILTAGLTHSMIFINKNSGGFDISGAVIIIILIFVASICGSILIHQGFFIITILYGLLVVLETILIHERKVFMSFLISSVTMLVFNFTVLVITLQGFDAANDKLAIRYMMLWIYTPILIIVAVITIYKVRNHKLDPVDLSFSKIKFQMKYFFAGIATPFYRNVPILFLSSYELYDQVTYLSVGLQVFGLFSFMQNRFMHGNLRNFHDIFDLVSEELRKIQFLSLFIAIMSVISLYTMTTYNMVSWPLLDYLVQSELLFIALFFIHSICVGPTNALLQQLGEVKIASFTNLFGIFLFLLSFFITAFYLEWKIFFSVCLCYFLSRSTTDILNTIFLFTKYNYQSLLVRWTRKIKS